MINISNKQCQCRKALFCIYFNR